MGVWWWIKTIGKAWLCVCWKSVFKLLQLSWDNGGHVCGLSSPSTSIYKLQRKWRPSFGLRLTRWWLSLKAKMHQTSQEDGAVPKLPAATTGSCSCSLSSHYWRPQRFFHSESLKKNKTTFIPTPMGKKISIKHTYCHHLYSKWQP